MGNVTQGGHGAKHDTWNRWSRASKIEHRACGSSSLLAVPKLREDGTGLWLEFM